MIDGATEIRLNQSFLKTGVGLTKQILLGKGDGTFSQPISVPATNYSGSPPVAGDFYGDGKIDLATQSM
jgi:hypothetical protein